MPGANVTISPLYYPPLICPHSPTAYLILFMYLSDICPQVRDIISAWGKPSQPQPQTSKGQASVGYRMENGRLYKLEAKPEVKQPQPQPQQKLQPKRQ